MLRSASQSASFQRRWIFERARFVGNFLLLAPGIFPVAGMPDTRRRQWREGERQPATTASYEEAEIGCGEAAEVWKHGREIAVIDAEPRRERREVLVAGRRWNPTAGVRIVGSVDGERGEFAVSAPAFDCAAHDEMMAAPTVIGALAVAGERAAKIARGECRDIIGQAELFHRALKDVHALAQFGEEVGMRTNGGRASSGRLSGVQIVTADLAEEDLTFHVEAGIRRTGRAASGFDQARDHLQLRAER